MYQAEAGSNVTGPPPKPRPADASRVTITTIPKHTMKSITQHSNTHSRSEKPRVDSDPSRLFVFEMLSTFTPMSSNASPISCRDALRSINAAHSLAAGYGAVERNRTPHSIALSRRGERPVFAWGIVSRFAEPSQRWGLFFPLATFVVSGEFASSRQAPLRALLGGTRVLGVALWPSIGAHRQRHVFRAVFCRAIVVGRRHS